MYAIFSTIATLSGVGLILVILFEPWDEKKCEIVAKVLALVFWFSSVLALGFAI